MPSERPFPPSLRRRCGWSGKERREPPIFFGRRALKKNKTQIQAFDSAFRNKTFTSVQRSAPKISISKGGMKKANII
jgi:hypothetical protein